MIRQILATSALTILISGATANAADPICGDVNDSGDVNTSDALLVLRKGVGQSVTIPCGGYAAVIEGCLGDLSTCQNAPVCGNAVIENGEECESGDLNVKTCVTEGFAGGTLGCAAGCTIDTSACYASRFDASGATIVDHQTGLEWEKKTTVIGSGVNMEDPHDVDNEYAWTAATTAPSGAAFTDFLGRLNGVPDASCYAEHCDWRLPTVEELLSTKDCSSVDLGELCTDPVFGPIQVDVYWSSTTYPGFPDHAYMVYTWKGQTADASQKTFARYVRAVRTGS